MAHREFSMKLNRLEDFEDQLRHVETGESNLTNFLLDGK